MRTIADELIAHPFFADIPGDYVRLLAGCGENVVFKADSLIASEGSEANEFYVIRRGRVALRLHTSATGIAVVQTLNAGDVLGWSWLFPSYRWSLEAVAVQDVSAIRLNGECLRGKCEADPAMGYDLMKRFSRIMSQRLEATRLQILDLYGGAGAS